MTIQFTPDEVADAFDPRKRASAGLLPDLIRRLIWATGGPDALKRLRLPGGDAVRLPGVDGEVEFHGVHPHLPEGNSVWEIGVGADAAAKATSDLRKRSAAATVSHAAQRTFVFATSRVWRGKDAWVEKQQRDTPWNEVVALDAVDLSAWLETTPAVAAWLSKQVGRPTTGVSTSEDVWAATAAGGLTLDPTLILGDRVEAAKTLRSWLAAPGGDLHLVASSTRSGRLFAAACIEGLPEAPRAAACGGTLFIAADADVTPLARPQRPRVHVVREGAASVPAAQASDDGTRLLRIRVSENAPLAADALRLPDLGQDASEELLRAGGWPEHRVYGLAREARGSLDVLLDTLQGDATGAPAWLEGVTPREAAPFLLAGAWSVQPDSPDHVALEALASCGYGAELEQRIERLSGDGGPLVRAGGSWGWRGREAAWRWVAGRLDPTLLQRFWRVAEEVLGERDPALDLPPDDRWLANLHGLERKHSPGLIDGVSWSLARLAVQEAEQPPVFGQLGSTGVAARVLGGPGRPEAERWLSLGPVLPLLAEAAPEAFLRRVEDFTEEPASLQPFLDAGGEHWPVLGLCQLLQGLERLAWSPEHFVEVVETLGRLAAVVRDLVPAEKRGACSPAPEELLGRLLLEWMPGTGATAEARVLSLHALRRCVPDVALDVAHRIVGKDMRTCFPLDTPKVQPWPVLDQEQRTPTLKEAGDYLRQVMELLLQWAQGDPAALTKIAELARPFAYAARAEQKNRSALHGMLLEASLSDEQRRTVCETLRIETSRSERREQRSDAEREVEDSLRELCEALQPEAPRLRHAWLFSSGRFSVLLHLDHGEEPEELSRIRREAVAEVENAEGLEGVLQWAEEVDDAAAIGFTLADLHPDLLSSRDFLQPLTKVSPGLERPAGSRLLIGFVLRLLGSGGSAAALAAALPADLGSEGRAGMALAFPPSEEVWVTLLQGDPEAERIYWFNVPEFGFGDDLSPKAAVRLRESGRPLAALLVMSRWCSKQSKHRGPTNNDKEVAWLIEALHGQLNDDEQIPISARSSGVSWALKEIFGYLQAALVELEVLATLQLRWFQLLDGWEGGHEILHAYLAVEPRFFVELLTVAKPLAAGDSPDEPLDAGVLRSARRAWDVLHHWHRPPGAAIASSVGDTMRTTGEDPSQPAETGPIDAGSLRAWVDTAIAEADACGRKRFAEDRIGAVLAWSGADHDGVWPGRAVQETIERLASRRVDDGFKAGCTNRRGVHFCGGDGKQENAIADRFVAHHDRLLMTSVRTRRLMKQLEVIYRQEAEGEVQDGRRDAFR